MKIAIKAFNILAVALAIAAGFLVSIFFLGTQDDHQKMIAELPEIFFTRFGVAAGAGLILIGMLILINLILNMTILNPNSINIKRLVIIGSSAIMTSSLIGCLIFFRII